MRCHMVTIFLSLAIFINTLLGTLPLIGPFISGVLMGIIIGKKELAMVVGFWGAVIGGAFSKIFLSFPQNRWHQNLLTAFGEKIAHYLQLIMVGNLFWSVLYFGLLGILGSYTGALLKDRFKE